MCMLVFAGNTTWVWMDAGRSGGFEWNVVGFLSYQLMTLCICRHLYLVHFVDENDYIVNLCVC